MREKRGECGRLNRDLSGRSTNVGEVTRTGEAGVAAVMRRGVGGREVGKLAVRREEQSGPRRTYR